MNNLVYISFFTIHLFGVIFPLGAAEPITATIGFVSSVMGIISFFWSPQTADNTFFSLMNAIDKFQISEKFSNIERQLESINERLPKQVVFNLKIDEFNRLIQNVDKQYAYMLSKAQAYANGTRHNRSDKERIEANIYHYFDNGPDTLTDIASKIYFTFTNNGSTVLQFIHENMQENQISACTKANKLRSYQQILQNIVTSVVVSQVKVYLTLKLAANYMNETRGEFYFEDYKYKIDELQKQYVDTLKIFKQLMSGASRDVWACNPKQHIENVTFIQLENVFQRQIVDILAFDEAPNENLFTFGKRKQLEKIVTPIGQLFWAALGAAHAISPYITPVLLYDTPHALTHRSLPTGEKFYNVINHEVEELNDVPTVVHGNTPVCKGYLWDCEPLTHLLHESKDDMFLVCHSTNNSSRRFDRIEVQYVDWSWYAKQLRKSTATFKRAYGLQKPCDPAFHNRSFIINSAVCACDETTSNAPTIVRSDYSYRFFFTMNMHVSTDHDNYVVTGARIGLYKGVIYPIIQEGQLLKGGAVNQSSLRWIDFAEDEDLQRLLTIPQNLEKLDWSDRTIKLGDVDLPADRVLTGLYFTRDNDEVEGLRGPLRLGLMWQKFDFNTGVVAPPEDWSFAQIKDDYGKENTDRFDFTTSDLVQVDNLPLPKLNDQSNVIISDGFVNFTTSDFKTDLGQTTVPYFDVQSVTTEIPTPMSGAGLYYKYKPGYVGFIGIKLKTYDMSQHFTEPTEALSESMKDEASFRNGNWGLIENQST